jgi:hypothetical protein
VSLSLEAVEQRLSQPAQRPLPGQEAIPVATIGYHAYEGPGACRAEDFGQACGKHRDEHHHTREDQR